MSVVPQELRGAERKFAFRRPDGELSVEIGAGGLTGSELGEIAVVLDPGRFVIGDFLLHLMPPS